MDFIFIISALIYVISLTSIKSYYNASPDFKDYNSTIKNISLLSNVVLDIVIIILVGTFTNSLNNNSYWIIVLFVFGISNFVIYGLRKKRSIKKLDK